MKKLVVLFVVVLTAAMAFGQTSAVTATSNTNTAATTLATSVILTANINTALALDIQQSGVGCVPTVGSSSPTKTYTFALGNVDGLGLSTPNACVTKTAAPAGANQGYFYTTPYKYIARFSGFSPTAPSPKLTAQYSQGTFSTSAVQVIEGATPATATALSTSSATNIATAMTSDYNNTGVSRVIGIQVLEFNGANATPNAAAPAAYSATVTYTLTPQ